MLTVKTYHLVLSNADVYIVFTRNLLLNLKGQRSSGKIHVSLNCFLQKVAPGSLNFN